MSDLLLQFAPTSSAERSPVRFDPSCQFIIKKNETKIFIFSLVLLIQYLFSLTSIYELYNFHVKQKTNKLQTCLESRSDLFKDPFPFAFTFSEVQSMVSVSLLIGGHFCGNMLALIVNHPLQFFSPLKDNKHINNESHFWKY